MITLKNEQLTVCVNPMGAELSSIKTNASAREYLWQGDPSVWNGRAPILFPIAGKLKNDTYIYNDKSFTLPKHGFARRNEFSVVSAEEGRAVFTLTESEKTLAAYPFPFRLTAEYALDGKTLTVTSTVHNSGADTMYFSFGAHPAFNINVGDSVVFAEKETFTTGLFNAEGLLDGEKTLAENTDRLIIDAHIFDNDAIFFENMKSGSAKIVSAEGDDILEMSYGKVPYLGLWAKPNAPYICIEPWFGICDHPQVSGKIEEKPYIIALAPEKDFVFSYTITIFN